MGWATNFIHQLQEGKTINFRPKGQSMSGKIESGNLVTVKPVSQKENLLVGSIVLCKINGNEYLHLIKAFRGEIFSG